jgi:hypothetical protein
MDILGPRRTKKADRAAAIKAELEANLIFAVIGNQWFEKHCAEIVPTTQKETKCFSPSL